MFNLKIKKKRKEKKQKADEQNFKKKMLKLVSKTITGHLNLSV